MADTRILLWAQNSGELLKKMGKTWAFNLSEQLYWIRQFNFYEVMWKKRPFLIFDQVKKRTHKNDCRRYEMSTQWYENG